MGRKKKKNTQPRQVPAPTTTVTSSPVVHDFKQLKGKEVTFGKVKVQGQGYTSATADLISSRRYRENQITREQVEEALEQRNIKELRRISSYLFQTSGIYARAVRYLADMNRWDTFVYPLLETSDPIDETKKKSLLKRYYESVRYMLISDFKSLARKWSLEVILKGAYYGYLTEEVEDRLVVQDLPIDYCRSLYNVRGRPLIEFNVRYFDDVCADPRRKEIMLNAFPIEIKKAYREYIKGGLPAAFNGDDRGWYPLDVNYAFCFQLNDNASPVLIQAALDVMDLKDVQGITKEGLLQNITKILVQKFPLNSRDEMVLSDVEQVALDRQVSMALADSPGVGVISTVAEIALEEIGDNSDAIAEKAKAVEDNLYNNLGISSQLFNTSGNLSLEKSIKDDESWMRSLLLEVESFVNNLIFSKKFNKEKGSASKLYCRILDTTQYNYIDVYEKYASLVKMGLVSRLLPSVSLGHNQAEALYTAKWDTQILDLDIQMLPPLSTNTLNAESILLIQELAKGNSNITSTIDQLNPKAVTGQSGSKPASGGSGGRPALPETQRTEKTIANQGG